MQAVRTHGWLVCLLRMGASLALVSCQVLRPPGAPPPGEPRPAPGAGAARALEAVPSLPGERLESRSTRAQASFARRYRAKGARRRPKTESWVSLLGEWEHLPGSRPTALCRAGELPAHFPPPAASRRRRLEQILERRARRLDPSQRRQVAEELLRAEKEMGLDPVLLLALIEQESSYDPSARGPRGSLGLMQVRPFVARDVAARHGIPWDGPGTLHDPGLNVRIGVGYFAELKRMYTDDTMALAAYNMGPYRLKRLLARGRIPSSRYVFRVLERYHDLRRER